MHDHELVDDKIKENNNEAEKPEKDMSSSSKSTLFKVQSEQELIKKIAYHEAYSTAYKLKLAQKVAVKVGKAAVKGAIKGSVAISKKINEIRKEQRDNKKEK